MHADLGGLGPAGDDVVVGVPVPGLQLREERGGHGKDGGEEPDQRDVDAVGPGPGHVRLLAAKVPLAVFHKEVEREEEDRQGQEEQEAVVEVPENMAVRSVFSPA